LKISIFIPAYNASPYIEDVIDRIPDQVWEQLLSLWIIDDGSSDTTGAIAETLAGKNSKIRPVHFYRNKGYGVVVQHGLALCRNEECDYAVCLHADGQYPPESIAPFVSSMQKENIDILQGSRIASGTALSGGMPVYKYFAGRLLTWLENTVFGMHMTDYHSGFLIYNRIALGTLQFQRLSRSFDIDLELIASARAQGLHVEEKPIPTRYAGEKSYLNPVTYGIRVISVVSKFLMGYYHSERKTWRDR